MKNVGVRIKTIEITNFKNVQYGKIDLLKNSNKYQSNILALYGQNGSGKTALIESLQLLKLTLCGKSIPPIYADYINVESDKSKFTFVFDINLQLGRYEVSYSFELSKQMESLGNNITNEDVELTVKAMIDNEVLYASFEGENKKIRKTAIINTHTDYVFSPSTKYNLLVGLDEKREMNLIVAKKIALSTSRGFIFSRELLNAIRKRNVYFHKLDDQTNEEITFFKIYYLMIERLITYGNSELFVISTRNTGMISLDVQPFTFKYRDESGGIIGNYIIPLDKEAVISLEEVNLVTKVIHAMNNVLSQIVPGLTIQVKELGTQLLSDNSMGYIIQLMSLKNKREIPLKYESEGIKKIISVLQLLISVYNESSITVAIDELDAGIFEYLLGELLRILSNKGKGQLIFTSHNLRPLETVNRDFIAFTTINPENRYMRLTNIQNNNNLRDLYYRNIVLGGRDEQLYDFVHNSEIDFAFREAGMNNHE